MINQNNVAADFAVKTLGFKTFALVHDTTDYGRAHAKWFGEFLEKAGGKVLSTQGTAKDQKDYTAELTRAKADRPESSGTVASRPTACACGCRWTSSASARSSRARAASSPTPSTRRPVRRRKARSRSSRAPRRRSCRGQAVPRGVREGGVQGAVGGLRALRLRRREPRHRRDRGGRPRPREGRGAAQADAERDHDHRPVEFDEYGQNTVSLISKYVSQDGKWVLWEDSEYASGKRALPGHKFKKM